MLLATLSLLGCTRTAVHPESADASGTAVPVAADRFSVYDLNATWRDQRGATRTLASLRGRPQLVAMIYTHCTSVCPLSVSMMKGIESRTDSTVGLVLVSLDPANDTPARLAAYAAEQKLSARWTLLSGSDESVRELAAAIGVRYRRISDTELAHANIVTVLNPAGEPIHQQAGLDGEAETLAAIRLVNR